MKRVWKWRQDTGNTITIQNESGEEVCQIIVEDEIAPEHEERARLICNAVNAYPQQLPERPVKKTKHGKEVEPQ